MKIRTHLTILLIIAAIGANAGTVVLAENHKPSTYFVNTDSAAGKVVSEFHRALESNDPTLARSLLVNDVLIFEGGVERSADEYASHHMLSDIKYLAAVKTTTLEHRVEVTGDLAVSVARRKTSGTYKEKKIDHESLETMVLRRIEDAWKITHIHWSH